MRVVARDGVAGLTHRRVAEAAAVPLGSTTYHFESLEDLLAAAVKYAKSGSDRRMVAWQADTRPEDDLAGALTQLIVQMTGAERDQLMVEYELYIAAIRRPALQQLSLAWDEALPAVLNEYTDALTSRALAMTLDGITLHSIVRGEPLTPGEVEPVLRRIMR